MNACPGCGGELYFDIKTQSLRCPFCNQKKDPGCGPRPHPRKHPVSHPEVHSFRKSWRCDYSVLS